MKVSVILPIYKVEPYIERCVRSLMEQTYDDVEFIFVDDASPDASIDIAKRVVSEYNRNVRFFTHPQNKGLPGARNTGLAASTGEYIYHCDSDDWLEPEMLEKMVKAATANDADFVYCDFFLSFNGKERYMVQPDFKDKFDALQKGVMTGNMKHNVWNKLIRHSLYIEYGICSPAEHCKGGEDYMIIKLLRVSNSVAHVAEALYHYNRVNANAITKTQSEKHYEDIKANADDVIAFLNENPIPNQEFLQFFKLDTKFPLLFEQSRSQIRRWKSWYPEANPYISRNKYISRRARMTQLFAKWGFYPLVLLYSWAIDHIYYGLLYNK